MDHNNLYQNENNKWKKSFLTIAIGQIISVIGSSAVQFSLIWWLASETASPLMMSLAGMLAYLPQFLLGPFAGVWVDRLKRKTIIICADMFIGIVAAAFALSFFLWEPPYWSACLVLGIRAIGSVFHTPAIQAAVPMLVPQDQLVRANGWSQFLQSGAYMIGPVLGAAMYASLPLSIILLTDLIGAVIASVSVAIVKIPELKLNMVCPNFLLEIKEGITVLLKDKKLWIITLATAVCMVFFMPLSSFFSLMTSDYFKASAWHASIIQIAYAFGMMVSAVAVSSLGKIKNKLGVVRIGIIALGIISLVCGLLPLNMLGFWIFTFMCLSMGASVNVYNIPYIAYMQETVPKEAQGRVFALLGSMMSITMPLGLLVAGPVAENLGVPVWFLVAGIANLFIMGISLIVTKHVK